MEHIVLVVLPAMVALALLFLGFYARRSERMFYKKAIKTTACIIGYKPIEGTFLVNPRVRFLDGNKDVKVICQTAGIKVEYYPPGVQMEVYYLRKPLLDKYVYEVRPADEKIRSISTIKLSNFLIVLAVIFKIVFFLLLTQFYQ